MHYEDEAQKADNYYKPNISVDFYYDEDYDLVVNRFAICFEGYGLIELNEENKVCDNIYIYIYIKQRSWLKN